MRRTTRDGQAMRISNETSRRNMVAYKALSTGILGEQGEAALEKASICLLNCGPTGSETLKNLVLGGVGSITIVDGSKVEFGDLGNNFMVDDSSLGQSKAKCVCSFLQELNDAVKAKFIEEHHDALIDTNPSFFSQLPWLWPLRIIWFYVSSLLTMLFQLVEESMVKLDRICRQENVMLIFARSYGLTGLVRISVKEHTVIESKPDHFLDDLRLNNPWHELRGFSEEIGVGFNLVHYVYKAKDLGHLALCSDLLQIINDNYAEVGTGSDFWVIVAALKEFIANEGGGEVPLEGSIPDMTSSSECYVSLQKICQNKSEADYHVIEERVRNILKKIGRDPHSIPKATMKSFCKNARKLKACRYRPIEEYSNPSLAELQKYLTDEDYGSSDLNFDASDISRLKTTAVSLLNDMGCTGLTLTEDLIDEMCRFGTAELHAVLPSLEELHHKK
ncbi:NEDD8-activating enzyme E1 regulatory subunit [Hibiscus syriacus]|uniref:NEDD8-activating enzyme E1 regulatory subunit n=1 Tax=Hibiscus syriacus TaxID=106335 RepID=A0A6A2YAI8_HIBSY|nr:NEDD8-activating enzyme E1 regulatory subunit [Hibiscus syriacus]